MRVLCLLVLLLTWQQDAFAKGGGTIPPPCAATAPSQATAVNYTNLVFCDTLATNQTTDVNNTKSPGFNWYPQQSFNTAGAIPASQILNDGTGQYTASTSVCCGMNTAAPVNTSGGWVGQGWANGFYAEVQMKWQGSGCATSWPVMWFSDILNVSTWTNSASYPQGTGFPQVEIDAFEFYQCGAPETNIYDWISKSSPSTYVNYGNSNNFPSMGTPTYSNYNTYGMLWVPAAQNGGTGYVKFYFNNVLKETVTYTPNGAPSPTTCRENYGGSFTCPNGTFADFDTHTMFMHIQGVIPADSSDLAVYQNVHVWQLSGQQPVIGPN